MRILIAVLIVAVSAGVANAQPIRFAGSTVATSRSTSPRDQAGVITFEGEYADDLSLPLDELFWKFDISTDGQSVVIHEMSASYEGTIQINPLVSVDLTLKASIVNKTIDINPTTTTVWKVQEHNFDAIQVAGTYHGLGLTKNFSGSLPHHWTTTGQLGLLDFAEWPNKLAWNATTSTVSNVKYPNETRAFVASSTNGWIGVEPYLHIREVQIWEPATVLLTPVASVGDSADFNSDGSVDGADFLHWQRNVGTSDSLELWKQQFGSAPVASSIPEPNAGVLVMMAISLLAIRCKQ